jgi:16S rRNA (guanine1516-N2)-methyltransferase
MNQSLSKPDPRPDPLGWLEVVAADSSMEQAAQDLAKHLHSLPLSQGNDENCRFILEVGRYGLSLQNQNQPKTRPLRLDAVAMRRNFSGRDLLARSIGRRCRSVVDVTAGFGHDAFHMFHLGKSVIAIERSPVVAVMLADAIDRLVPLVRSDSLKLICDDARQRITQIDPPDVIYLDPMFPDRQGRSALAGKELQILRTLVGDDKDADGLLHIAQSVALQRVVVKRPAWAGPLGRVPDLEYRGRAVRYDAYLTA